MFADLKKILSLNDKLVVNCLLNYPPRLKCMAVLSLTTMYIFQITASFFTLTFSKCSEAACLWCGGMFMYHFVVGNLPLSLTVKEF